MFLLAAFAFTMFLELILDLPNGLVLAFRS